MGRNGASKVTSKTGHGGTIILALFLAGCTSAQGADPSVHALVAGASSAARPAAYLAAAERVDGIALVPPAPAPGSATEARDLDGARRALALRGTARWDLATSDAELFTPTATAALSCAAGRRIDASATPATFALLNRAAIDFSGSTAAAKDKYQRQRPFMARGEPTCTPASEATLRTNGSYPSGHSAIGFGWGLVLAQLLPERASALVARGRAFGDSRRICNVHWLSDVEEGRISATATYARLQSSAAFQQDLDAARRELAEKPAVAPARDCAAEAAALAMQ